MDIAWKLFLEKELQKPYMQKLKNFLKKEEEEKKEVYPPSSQIFSAFEFCDFDKLKVVIVGQDPYHGKGQAHGLSFSVPSGIKPPPSLQNIFKELHQDLKIPISSSGNLTKWAKQGVLLLNATLTVRESEPKSHLGQGWEEFTDAIIRYICEKKDCLVFLLWGKVAAEKVEKIATRGHLILKAAHPSPFSAHSGFFGCNHFSKTNQFLIEQNKEPIDWSL